MILTIPIIGKLIIRRVGHKKPRPMDTQSYHHRNEEKKRRTTEALKREIKSCH